MNSSHIATTSFYRWKNALISKGRIFLYKVMFSASVDHRQFDAAIDEKKQKSFQGFKQPELENELSAHGLVNGNSNHKVVKGLSCFLQEFTSRIRFRVSLKCETWFFLKFGFQLSFLEIFRWVRKAQWSFNSLLHGTLSPRIIFFMQMHFDALFDVFAVFQYFSIFWCLSQSAKMYVFRFIKGSAQ